MEFVLLFALAVIVALFANAVGPRVYATSFGTRLQANYAGRTVSTAVVIFVALIAGAFVMSAIKEPVMLPKA